MATIPKEGHKAVSTQRARFLKAQADRAELALKKAKGELVDAEEVKRAAFDVGRRTRDAMLNIPPRVEALIQAEVEAAGGPRIDLARVREILDKEITSALNDFVNNAPTRGNGKED